MGVRCRACGFFSYSLLSMLATSASLVRAAFQPLDVRPAIRRSNNYQLLRVRGIDRMQD